MKKIFSETARKYSVLAEYLLVLCAPEASAQFTVTVPWPDAAEPESHLFRRGWVIGEINTNPWSPATINFAIPSAPDITGTWHMTNHQKTVDIDGATGAGRISGTLIFGGWTLAKNLNIGTNSFFLRGGIKRDFELLVLRSKHMRRGFQPRGGFDQLPKIA